MFLANIAVEKTIIEFSIAINLFQCFSCTLTRSVSPSKYMNLLETTRLLLFERLTMKWLYIVYSNLAKHMNSHICKSIPYTTSIHANYVCIFLVLRADVYIRSRPVLFTSAYVCFQLDIELLQQYSSFMRILNSIFCILFHITAGWLDM